MPALRILLATAMLALAGTCLAAVRIIPQESGVRVEWHLL